LHHDWDYLEGLDILNHRGVAEEVCNAYDPAARTAMVLI
jgi:hypothetical protein